MTISIYRAMQLVLVLVGTSLCSTAGAGEPSPKSHNSVLHLRSGRVDTSVQERWAGPRTSQAGRHVIQLSAAITRHQREVLEDQGMRLGRYLPTHAYVAKLRPDQVDAVKALPFVQWVGTFLPEWKLDPAIATPVAQVRSPNGSTDTVQVVICLFESEEAAPVLDRLHKLDAAVIHTSTQGTMTLIDAIVPTNSLTLLAQLDSVQFIEAAPQGQLRNDSNSWIMQTNAANQNSVWDQGLHGENEIIGLIDGPFDTTHCSFTDTEPIGFTHRKVVAYRGTLGTNDHGTHTAGTLAGDAGTNGVADFRDGISFASRISFSDFFAVNSAPSTLYARFQDAFNDGAFVHSNSFGAFSSSYATWSEQSDRFSHDNEDALIVFAVANGTAAIAFSPENAKNVLAVSATMDSPDQDSWCDGISGPTFDGRRKPEVMAPGCGTMSSQFSTACSWTSMTGTSMACPAIAGSAVLARQYFTEGYYPSGAANPGEALIPSGALLRAVLINSAVDATNIPASAAYPSNQEGWGRLVLENALYFAGDARNLYVEDVRNASGFSTGEDALYVVEVTDINEPLRFTLVWTDVEGALFSTDPVVNNLDLTVEAPDGSIYLGNQFDTAAGESQIGGTSDPLNTVEQVHFLAPQVGYYRVRIAGTAVNQGTQGYALAVTGALGINGPAPQITLAASCNDHGGAGEFCFALGDSQFTQIEMRAVGAQRIQVDLDSDFDPLTLLSANVDVNCASAGTYAGTITVTNPASNQSVIEFDPSLPNEDCCQISLLGFTDLAGVAVTGPLVVLPLRGDVDRNGTISTGDASLIKPHFGETLDASNFQFDYNGDGVISTGDASMIKPLFGGVVGSCP